MTDRRTDLLTNTVTYRGANVDMGWLKKKFLLAFLVACTRLYKSLCRSVGWSVGRSVGLSVGLSHFAFFAFLGYLQVGKHIFEYLESYKQHSRLYKSPCRSVRPSVGPSHFAFFAFLGYLEVGKHIFKYLMIH